MNCYILRTLARYLATSAPAMGCYITICARYLAIKKVASTLTMIESHFAVCKGDSNSNTDN